MAVLAGLVLVALPLPLPAMAILAGLCAVLVVPLLGMSVLTRGRRTLAGRLAFLLSWGLCFSGAAVVFVWALTARWSGYPALPGALCGLALGGAALLSGGLLDRNARGIAVLLAIVVVLVLLKGVAVSLLS